MCRPFGSGDAEIVTSRPAAAQTWRPAPIAGACRRLSRRRFRHTASHARLAAMTATRMYLTGDDKADALLAADGNALLIGMVLDQQVPMEKAFSGPAVIAERMGGRLDVTAIAAADPEEFAALCARPPAVHRFPGSMAGRVQAVCRVLVESTTVTPRICGPTCPPAPNCGSGSRPCRDSARRRRPSSWRCSASSTASAPGGGKRPARSGSDGSRVSVADVVDAESLAQVRAAKRAAKAAAKPLTDDRPARGSAPLWAAAGSADVDPLPPSIGVACGLAQSGGWLRPLSVIVRSTNDVHRSGV